MARGFALHRTRQLHRRLLWCLLRRERESFIDNLLVRIHYHRDDDFSRPALRYGSLNSFFQVAFYLGGLRLGFRYGEATYPPPLFVPFARICGFWPPFGVSTRWSSRLARNSERNVAEYAPHKALKIIA